jgi:hypothetical protein
MPLARIITDVADDSLELTMQLRARGFQVETIAPNEIPRTPADLEVRVEECGREDVLNRAQIGDVDDVWVFVAPGALDDSVRPMRPIAWPPRVSVAPVIRAPKIVKPEPLPGVKREPATIRALPVDGFDEDLILAELEDLRIEAAAVASQRPSPPAKTETEQKAVLLNPTQSKADSVVAGPALVPSNGKPDQNASPLVAVATAAVPVIPIAPEPAQWVIAPTAVAARRVRPIRRWNLRPWKIAAISAATVFVSWFLVGGLRPEAAPTGGQSTVSLSPAAASLPRAPQDPVMASRDKRQPEAKARMVTPSDRGRAPQIAHTSPHPFSHARGDGVIAEDTVIFYDRKPSGTRAKAQTPPIVKRYSDQN